MQDMTKDFFISYNKADRAWAEWIAWQLEAEGYTTVLQDWDFRPGSNFVLQMHKAIQKAKRTIAVLSPSYLEAFYTQPEWAAALVHDPTGQKSTLLPIRVHECEPIGLLAAIIYIDLVGLDEDVARTKLLQNVGSERAKPKMAPKFPKGNQYNVLHQPGFPGNSSPIWNVPYRRNPFFTGRETLIKQLHEKLTATKVGASTQPQAISGLGGIGKTQVAIEYAYRHQNEYEVIFWVRADSQEILISEIVSIANVLNLPEKNDQDQNRIVDSVKRWLKVHRGWLLIIDNIEDLELVDSFTPSVHQGSILLTTRTQVTEPIAQAIDLEKMGENEGALFLLRRAKLIALDALLDQALELDLTKAREISRTMDGFPLALDQAGAYILETKCGVSRYLDLYQKRQAELLKQRGKFPSGHPESVTTTFSLCFEKVEKTIGAAAELLQFCAFLYPDDIPEEIITEGAYDLGPVLQSVAADPLELDKAIGELRKYSLVYRDPGNQTLTIHRLVQTVLKDEMDEDIQRQWAECVVQALNHIFPSVELATWARCQRYILHALVCSAHIDQWNMASMETVRLPNQVGSFLQIRGLYRIAEPFCQQALAITEKILGAEHPNTVICLNNLASLYKKQGKYTQAEPLCQRTLMITEKVLGPEHPDTARSLNGLATLYEAQGKYEQAEPLFKQALEIRQKVLGLEHPDTARSLNNLAELYYAQGKYPQAEPLFKQALAIRERVLIPEHPDTTQSFNSLATLYEAQGKYEQAEPLFKRALEIREKILGPEHPDTAQSLNNLAGLYHTQGKNEQAEPLYQRALAIQEKMLGTEHPDTAISLNNLGTIYCAQEKYKQAESYMKRALAIQETALGAEHPATAQTFDNLGALYFAQDKYELAESFYQQALANRRKILGNEHLATAQSLEKLGILYQTLKQFVQAETFYLQALAIREKVPSPENPDLVSNLCNLGTLYYTQYKYEQAESYMKRALAIQVNVLGPNHPNTTTVLNNYISILRTRGHELRIGSGLTM